MDIGEIFLGSFFQVLFDKLSSLALDYVQREGTSTIILDEWKGMLVKINALLDAVEDKQLSGDHLVKLWLDDVRDLANDMEHLLEEFEIEAARAKSEEESNTSRGRWKRKFSFLSRPRLLVSDPKVHEIKRRFEDIVTKKAPLSLRENVVDRSNYTNKRLPSTSLSELHFFGREKEEARILELLISDVQNSDATLSIVPIVGMGGVGKTALAQRLYNHDKVKSCFERRAWVCVSDVFDVLDITKTILRSVTGLPSEGEDLNGLQVKLKDSLAEKKLLVVLDDVWNEKYEEWTVLLKPFEAGAKGSKIIVTARNLPVAYITGASPYTLKELSLDNCTSLLAQHALGERNFERHAYLETVGKKIAAKCKGLPLAAKILGGLLRNKENPDEWKAILNDRIWEATMEKNDEVLPALKLSYVHLPSYLKRCFAYCAIFPKDYEFERDELVLLWIAMGFVDGRKANENILRPGRNYFDELVSRSFFQQSSVNTSKFSMHDLLNDLAKSIAGGTCFTSGESQPGDDEHDASLDKKALYASFISSRYVTSRCLRAYDGMKILRSLMVLRVGIGAGSSNFSISNKALHELLTNSKYLRVLSLCHCNIIKVPDCVSDLKHLRYLNLSYTNIIRLPESIGGLCKLQALILRGCQRLTMLPPDITNLVSLQFLDIRDTESLKEMPLSIGNLKNLIILSKFVVALEKGSQLKELKNLPHLQGGLIVSELQKVKEVRDANLLGKEDLSNLILLWDEDFGNLRNDEREEQVLRALRPHTNLENLTISYYGGGLFPSWLGDPSYSKIVSLCLRGCPNVKSLPSLGQLPSLRELSLEGLNAVSVIGSEFYGIERPFPSLTILKFDQMSAWKDWSPYAEGQENEVPFSYLQHLVVRSCRALMGTLPCRLDHLIKLEIGDCPRLNESTSMVCLPSLRELYLVSCNKEIFESLVELTSLTILEVLDIEELVCFDPGFMSCMHKLKELNIRGCDKLTYLWQDGNETRKLTCLQSVVIQHCPRFTSFVAGEGEIELLCNLEWMELTDCTSLERLPSKMHALRRLSISNCPKIMGPTIPPDDPDSNNTMSQLEYLEIRNQDSRISFPFAEGRLAALRKLYIWEYEGLESLEEITEVESLKSLVISDCKNLGSLPQCLRTLAHLTRLSIFNCPALEIEDFPPLPLTLSYFALSECPKIKSITNCNVASCKNLTELDINCCPELEVEDFPPLPMSISSLKLFMCPKIKSLPNEWHRLTSLRFLFIVNCENIKSFPKGDLPPDLRSFFLWGCENLKQPMREWGLHMLTSLEILRIDGRSMGGEGEKVRFPSEENEEDAWSLLFPSSLTKLAIGRMKNVERLSSGLRNRLSSLRSLEIYDCPKLRYLPEDGLPPSLQELWINGCEILKDRCSNLGGDYWPLIQDIPLVDIDGHQIW
ncbi:putative disease resistance protein At3g14460 isoform X2 [Syzygium oleosum]|uniref:putative disease resistance protein At3g14460 isoform X2 n=1 Tax=Syzygium oleosum TaxID=219896 RepID=UPI0024BBB32F|nr:putative disease resistance protein At3g14460 isoform X2 [Syzygium oleosum]